MTSDDFGPVARVISAALAEAGYPGISPFLSCGRIGGLRTVPPTPAWRAVELGRQFAARPPKCRRCTYTESFEPDCSADAYGVVDCGVVGGLA